MSPDNDAALRSPSSGPALFEEPAAGGVRCTLCPHLCVIGENAEGLCKARGVRDGRLVSLTYGRPASVISDEIEKKPLFHFHPGHPGPLAGLLRLQRALHPDARTGRYPTPTRATRRRGCRSSPPTAAVALAKRHKLSGVAFTYNDPVVWIEYVHDVCAAFKEAGLYTAFITAGYMTEAAVDYVGPVVEAFKFDLKAANAEGWARLTKVKDPAPALAAAVRAKEKHGCHVEVVSNIVPGLNDDDASLRAMAGWVRDALGPKTPWHVTRFLPEFELSYLPATPIKTLERAVAARQGRGTALRVRGERSRTPGPEHRLSPLRAHRHRAGRAEGAEPAGERRPLRRVWRRPQRGGWLGVKRRMIRSTMTDRLTDLASSPVSLAIPCRPEYVALCRLVAGALGARDSPGRGSGRRPQGDRDRGLQLLLGHGGGDAARRARRRSDGGCSIRMDFDSRPDAFVISVLYPERRGLVAWLERCDPMSEAGLGLTILRALTDEMVEIDAGRRRHRPSSDQALPA